MKKRRMRLMALVVAAMMICGLAIAEPVHEHQWSAWQKSMDYPNQETRTCLMCNAVETREHEWGPWIDQGDGTESTSARTVRRKKSARSRRRRSPWAKEPAERTQASVC